MTHIYLNFLAFDRLLSSKLFANLEETFLDLTLNTWLKLFLHIVKLQVLAFEILEGVALLFGVAGLHVLHYWFTLFELVRLLVVIYGAMLSLIRARCLTVIKALVSHGCGSLDGLRLSNGRPLYNSRQNVAPLHAG